MTGEAWYEQYKREEWIDRLTRRFNWKYAYMFEDPEDALGTCIERYMFKGLPTLTVTYWDKVDALVKTCFHGIVIDYFREQYGDIRAPVKLRAQGRAYRDLFFRHCLGRFQPEEICHFVKLSIDRVLCCIDWIERERKCPERRWQMVSIEDPETERAISDSPFLSERENPTPDQALEWAERQAYGRALLAERSSTKVRDGESSGLDLDDTHFPTVTLTPNEWLVLNLMYREGQTQADTAEALHVRPHTVKNMHKRIVSRVRRECARCGFEV